MQKTEVFPANLFVKLTKANPELVIDPPMTKEGDICFRIPIEGTGLTRATWNKTPLVRAPFAMNYLGELLVRKNLDAFLRLLNGIDPSAYHRVVNSYRHQCFGYKSDGDSLRFWFHISLLQRILLEDMQEMMRF